MISKKRLRERLEDIAAGAGMEWMDDDWISDLEAVERFMRGVSAQFGLGYDDLTRISWLADWVKPDALTERIHYLIGRKEAGEE